MMNPSIVVFLDATGGDVRKIILERLVRPHVPMLQERKSKEILEAPPGFEPGMEVLQGHPRWFRVTAASAEHTGNHACSIGCHQSPVPRYRVWRWPQLVLVGSPRAQFGHMPTECLTLLSALREPSVIQDHLDDVGEERQQVVRRDRRLDERCGFSGRRNRSSPRSRTP